MKKKVSNIFNDYKQGIITGIIVLVTTLTIAFFQDIFLSIVNHVQAKHSDIARLDTLMCKNRVLTLNKYEDSKSYTDAVAERSKKEVKEEGGRILKDINKKLDLLMKKAVLGDLMDNKRCDSIMYIDRSDCMLYVGNESCNDSYDIGRDIIFAN